MPAQTDALLKLQVPVIVRLAETSMPLDDVLALSPGALIEFPKNADEELELLASDRPIGAGRAVKVGENFGLRITTIGNVRDRIDALGGRPAVDG